jgi:hypothetical protein
MRIPKATQGKMVIKLQKHPRNRRDSEYFQFQISREDIKAVRSAKTRNATDRPSMVIGSGESGRTNRKAMTGRGCVLQEAAGEGRRSTARQLKDEVSALLGSVHI